MNKKIILALIGAVAIAGIIIVATALSGYSAFKNSFYGHDTDDWFIDMERFSNEELYKIGEGEKHQKTVFLISVNEESIKPQQENNIWITDKETGTELLKIDFKANTEKINEKDDIGNLTLFNIYVSKNTVLIKKIYDDAGFALLISVEDEKVLKAIDNDKMLVLNINNKEKIEIDKNSLMEEV